MISLDTETTGVDFNHGSMPYFVSICDSKGVNYHWEWDVDPTTRQPTIPNADKKEIRGFCSKAKSVVLQNAKFDVRALEVAGIVKNWDWSKTFDTLIAGHLLASNERHNLASMCLKYLLIDIDCFDKDIETETKRARNYVRSVSNEGFKDWRIAKSGLAEMPSIKSTLWKSDMWLPRAVAKKEQLEDHHKWWTVLEDYANSDSAATLALFKMQKKLLKKRKLWKIYKERLKLLPISYRMESIGVTLNRDRLEELSDVYKKAFDDESKRCLKIAEKLDYDLELPKSGNNDSLHRFLFTKQGLNLPAIKTSDKTGKPLFNKQTIDEYKATLKPGNALRFIEAIETRKKRGTSLQYLDGYKRFWLPTKVANERILFPSLNITGTDTLRWSSSNPNEQNISKQKIDGKSLRYCFGPSKDREWWSLDYDNLELRIPAYECQEPAMLELFEHPTEPPFFGSYHLLIFSILHPEKWKRYGAEVKNKYKDTYYSWTKNGNFADMYGAMPESGTADRAFHVDGAQLKVAARLKKRAKLNEHWIDYANKNGYVETMPDKTVDPKRGYPLLCARTKWGNVLPTIPLNYHVQGTACWIIAKAMVKVSEFLKDKPGYNMIMQVHDELVFDFPKGKLANLPIIRDIQNLMESCGDDVNVPLTCGVSYHPENWGEEIEV